MSKPKVIRNEMNVWAFLESIFKHAINKAQLLPLGLILFILLLGWRIPEEEVGEIANRLLTMAQSRVGFSYALNVVVIISWYFHSRAQRRSISGEMERMGREKTAWQEQKLGLKLSNPQKTGKNPKQP